MKLASIEEIKEIRPHPNADKLDLAYVLGWQAVVRKGEFSAGERCVFIVIDTILPDAPWSEFLKKGDKPIRLRTVKLRGEFSQGLVLPMSVLPENVQRWGVGSDVGSELGVKRYEKEILAQLSGEVKCSFPEYLAPKTDEDNGLSNPELVEGIIGKDCVITQKLDGSSMTVIVQEGEIQHVCSRRMSLKKSDTNSFWIAAKKIDLPLTGFYIIQGELMGPGIQGNQLELKSPEMFVFQIWMGGKWLEYSFMRFVARKLCLQSVPFVDQKVIDSSEEVQEIADRQFLPSGESAEGVVVRPSDMRSSGIGRPLGFKIINRNYGE